MLTLSQLRKAAKLKQYYGETPPPSMGCGHPNMHQLTILPEATPDDNPDICLTVEYDAEAKEFTCL